MRLSRAVRPEKKIWFITETPTPQRSPSFNELAVYFPTAKFLYIKDDDGGRAWGEIEIHHDSIFWNRLKKSEKIVLIWELLTLTRKDTVASFGYRGAPRIAALFGSRLTRTRAIVRSDTNQLMVESLPLTLRLLKRLILRLIVPVHAEAWVIGSQNERFWRVEGRLKAITQIPYEVPILPGNILANDLKSRESNPERMTILFVGRLIEIKRVADLIMAFSRLVEPEYENWKLEIVGDGPLRQSLEAQSVPDSRVNFRGALNYKELGSVMACSDILVLPSSYESWGLVVNEALGYGLYVITTDVVASAQDLLDESTGTLFKVGDIEQLTKALKTASSWTLRAPQHPRTRTAELMFGALRDQ